MGALPSEFTDLMEEVFYYPFTGQDNVGNNTYGSACALHVRREGETTSFETSPGDSGTTVTTEEKSLELIADYVQEGVAIKGNMVIDGVTYRVTEVVTHTDENGPYYQDVKCSTNKER